MNLNTILLQAASGGGGGILSSPLLMFGLMALVFFFFIIRPQMKKQKELKTFRESLKTGDYIVTIGGIHGKITALGDTTVTIKVEGGSALKVERTALITDFATHQQGKR